MRDISAICILLCSVLFTACTKNTVSACKDGVLYFRGDTITLCNDLKPIVKRYSLHPEYEAAINYPLYSCYWGVLNVAKKHEGLYASATVFALFERKSHQLCSITIEFTFYEKVTKDDLKELAGEIYLKDRKRDGKAFTARKGDVRCSIQVSDNHVTYILSYQDIVH